MTSKRFADVWTALEATPAEAANMRARSHLMSAVRKAVEGWKTTQQAAAKRLGVTQPRLNDLLKGKIDKFSLDALVTMATQAGLKVTVRATPAA
jgi:predicted XRE-type DNA-binding protein